MSDREVPRMGWGRRSAPRPRSSDAQPLAVWGRGLPPPALRAGGDRGGDRRGAARTGGV